MLVKELRDALKDMPGEMHVYNIAAHGIAQAKHIFRGNLIGVEQFCELRTYFEDHTPQFEDIKIERETGFKNRDELIAAYLKLSAASNEAAQCASATASVATPSIDAADIEGSPE